MNFSALYSIITVVNLLKSPCHRTSLILKNVVIKDKGHLISDTIGIMRIFCCFHLLQTEKIIVFDN